MSIEMLEREVNELRKRLRLAEARKPRIFVTPIPHYFFFPAVSSGQCLLRLLMPMRGTILSAHFVGDSLDSLRLELEMSNAMSRIIVTHEIAANPADIMLNQEVLAGSVYSLRALEAVNVENLSLSVIFAPAVMAGSVEIPDA